MPARARDEPETVARGFRRADTPACGGGACFQRLRRPDEKERQTRIGAGKVQPLARLQIEPVDHSGDRKRHARMQGLRQGPQSVFAVRRFDQSDARRIEAEAVEPMSVEAAMFALPVGRHDEDDRFRPPAARTAAITVRALQALGKGQVLGRGEAPQHGDRESESCRKGRCRRGDDLMQGAGGQAALR
jgi:hypothetical protein